MSTSAVCPACAGNAVRQFLEIRKVPVHVGSLWPTPEAAKACPFGDMVLNYCEACGYVFNAAFDSKLTEYTHAYDNSLEASGVFMDYARQLAANLIERYDLHNKTVVEIGCGKGAFISLLCEMGPNRGFGFDTTFDERTAPSERVTFVKAHYSEEQTGDEADFVCSRHVFEHIPQPLPFLQMVRRSLAERHETVVYFEVPESLFIFRDESIWDLMYEHCGYFTPQSLAGIFTRCGFDVLAVADAFGDQFLGIEAKPARRAQGQLAQGLNLAAVGPYLDGFAERFQARKRQWQEQMQQLRGAGKRICVWGAGGKTVSFMNLFRIADDVESVVDINPRKQGHFLPGTGHAILPPEALKARKPDAVIVMNKNYTGEVKTALGDMGLNPIVLEA